MSDPADDEWCECELTYRFVTETDPSQAFSTLWEDARKWAGIYHIQQGKLRHLPEGEYEAVFRVELSHCTPDEAFTALWLQAKASVDELKELKGGGAERIP